MTTNVYLDHAATTQVRPEVIAAMAEQMAVVGNASSLHSAGRAARRVVEESREQIAEALGASPSEVIFTSGGTESNNIAIKGAFGRAVAEDAGRRGLVVGTTEHHASLDPVEFLVERHDARVLWLEVDHDGVPSAQSLRSTLEQAGESVALVTAMWANNEVGAIAPVAELSSVAREFGVPFHTDAVQAVGHVPVDFAGSGADLLSLSGHKFGGPQGVGALLARRDVKLVPLTHGGGQERQIRSGTLDVAGIRGLAAAVSAAVEELAAENDRLVRLRDRLVERALGLDLGISVSGPYTPGDTESRLAGNVHLRVPDCDGDSLLYLLDAAGIECSTGSACQAGVPQPSHVLLAMGYSQHEARGALRMTLGRTTTEEDVDAAVDALPAAVERARRAHHAGRNSA
ncbi:cysteine desulfurase [Yimella sp. cx-573]|nr:cysteine desulfurase [Yimella sp. cx-573]